MNKKLKAKIVEKYGTQFDFASAIGEHEAVVSRVVRGRRTLSEADRQRWARLLGADSDVIFRKETDHA